MSGINIVAVIVSAVVAFIVSAVWYIVWSKPLAQLNSAYDSAEQPRPLEMLLELIRSLVVAFVLALLIAGLGISTWTGGLELGLWLWVGFPVVLLAGSVLHEHVPRKLAAIHAGDWLLKLLLMAVILSVWR